LHYTSSDPANLAVVDEAARAFGVTGRFVSQGNWQHLYLPAPHRLTRGRRNPIVAWLDSFGIYGRRSHEKFIPRAVFGFDDDRIRLFLRHLWSTDGSVTISSKGAVRIYYATTSRRLASDVQTMLLRLGIPTRLRSVAQGAHRRGYTVDVSGASDQRAFLARVGVHGRRDAIARQAAARLAPVHSNPNVDTIPLAVWGLVRQAAGALGMNDRALQAAVGSPYCGSTFYKHSPSRPRLAALASTVEAPRLHDLATSDILWETVVGIDPLGPEPVYDATVLDTHNFIAGGIVTHNSIEQDSDVVIFLYREAEQNPDSDVELVKAKIAKHRNGPIGEVPLQFRKANTRFYTVATHEDVAVY
jgi:replicative DNA helicase